MIPEAVFLTLMSLLYFQGVYTSDRILKAATSNRFNLDDKERARLKQLGPVKLRSPNILISTLLLAAPLWFARILEGTWFHTVLIYVSLAAFLQPLDLPSLYDPGREDLFVQKSIFLRILTGYT